MAIGRKANGQLKKGFRLTKSGVRKVAKKKATKRTARRKKAKK